MVAVIQRCADWRNLFCASVAMSLALVLSACVTINIYFPAAAAEKAADKVIDEVWQLPASQTTPTNPAATQEPAPQPVQEPTP